MLASAVIVFRETLEAALIVAIVLGASRGVLGRGRWVLGGIGLGTAGALLVALFAGAIASAVEGRGQELFNAAVLIAAVLMLAWHNIWMASHARQHVAEMHHLGHDVREGVRPLSAMLAVTALAVLREGGETVLFLYGLWAGGGSRLELTLGGVAGLCGGALVGVLLYLGLLRIPLRHFFTVTGAIVLLLAAGLAAGAANYLAQAGLLPRLVEQVWDSSALLGMDSFVGRVLHVLVGYNDRPSGIELVFYLVTLFTIGALMRREGRRRSASAANEKPAPVAHNG
jgi:high-affinity iron transporter